MKFFILTFLVTASSIGLAQNIDSTKCGVASLEILYLNGVLTKIKGASDSRDQIFRLVEGDSDKTRISPNGLDDICYKYIYNQTEGIYDLVEVLAQKIREANPSLNEKEVYKKVAQYWFSDRSWLANMPGDFPEKLEEAEIQRIQNTEYNTLHSDVAGVVSEDLKERSVLVVSHSQGNLFANLLYNELKANSNVNSRLSKYANLQVGSAASHIASESQSYGDYYTNKQDLIISSLGKLGTILVPNVEMHYVLDSSQAPPFPKIYDFKAYDPTGHFFVGTYTNESVLGRSSGEENYRSMSSIFMDKLGGLAEKILKGPCKDGLEMRVYLSSDDLSGRRFVYPLIFDQEGNLYQEDHRFFKLYRKSLEADLSESELVLDEKGEEVSFNRVNYLSESQFQNIYSNGIQFNLIYDGDISKVLKGEAPSCNVLTGWSRSIVSVHLDNRLDPGFINQSAAQYSATLDIWAPKDVVSASFGGQPMVFVGGESSLSCAGGGFVRECSFGYKGPLNLPGALELNLITGETLSFSVSVPEPNINFSWVVDGSPSYDPGSLKYDYIVKAKDFSGPINERTIATYTDVWLFDDQGNFLGTDKLGGSYSIYFVEEERSFSFYCGKNAVATPVQRLNGSISGNYFRFDKMKVIGSPCSEEQSNL